MRARQVAILLILLAIAAVTVASTPAPFSVGFGVGAPYETPVDWAASFSYLTTEILLSHNLTAVFDLGTYPSEFPNLFEGTAGILVKAWVGPVNAFAGGGFTLQSRAVGTAWGFSSYLTLKGGFQIWLLESLAFVAQFRTLESLPVEWTFSPELSFGLTVALGSGRPDPLFFDPATLWLVVGLGVAALIGFLPKE